MIIPAGLTDVRVKEKNKVMLIPWFGGWADRKMTETFAEIWMTDKGMVLCYLVSVADYINIFPQKWQCNISDPTSTSTSS